MSNLVLSNLTINGRPVGLFEPDPIPQFDSVVISGVTWTTQLLNIDDGQGGIIAKDNVTINGNNLGTVYYYNYAAANRIAESINGWHLPTYTETDAMVNYLGGYNSTTAAKLKYTSIWSNPGNNSSGFSAIPYGLLNNGSPSYGNESTFWNIGPSNSSYRMYVLNNNSMRNSGEDGTRYYYTLRLIKDT